MPKCFVNKNQQIVQAVPMSENEYIEFAGRTPYRIDRAGWRVVSANGEVTWSSDPAFKMTHREITEAERVLMVADVFVAKGYDRVLPGESLDIG